MQICAARFREKPVDNSGKCILKVWSAFFVSPVLYFPKEKRICENIVKCLTSPRLMPMCMKSLKCKIGQQVPIHQNFFY